ncbi:uncharacterized protein TNCV_3553191 [Trichonephila clavipes]|nr:uncharacterized protein TNCV_3553191 [Trichonephila clavipes]
MEVIRVEQHAYIKTAVLRKINEMECHSELVEALGNNVLPYRTVATRWIGKFQQGRVSSSDEQRSGRPVSARTDLARAVIEQLMDEGSWTTLRVYRPRCYTMDFGARSRNFEPQSSDEYDS